MADKWVKRWKVPKSNGDGSWTVAVDKEGNYGCSCPAWKFQRLPFAERIACHHIIEIQGNGGKELTKRSKPKYILAVVLKPTYKEQANELFIPLVAIPDLKMMEATICFYLLKYGYSWQEVKELRNIPYQWTKKAVLYHVEKYGEAEYSEDFYNAGRR